MRPMPRHLPPTNDVQWPQAHELALHVLDPLEVERVHEEEGVEYTQPAGSEAGRAVCGEGFVDFFGELRVQFGEVGCGGCAWVAGWWW